MTNQSFTSLDETMATVGVVAGELVAIKREAASGTFAGIEAATGTALPGTFANASTKHVAQACEAADEAFKQLRVRDDGWSASLLRGVADRMDARKDEILSRCGAETGYIPSRVAGEFARATGQLRLFAKLADERWWDERDFDPAEPNRQPIPRQEMRRRLLPIGPIAVFGACNFPLAISVVGNDFVAGIAVGCPAVVKAHPGHPGTCQLLGEIVAQCAEELGLPLGVFSLLQSVAPETSLELVEHPAICAVGFTGSPGGGKAIAECAVKRAQPIPVFAELGSTNPVFITAQALAERGQEIAKGFVGSLGFGNGQLCTKPSILVIPEGSATEFVQAVTDGLSEAPVLPVLGERIAEDFDRGVEKLRSAPGVTSLFSGCSDDGGPFHRGAQWFQMSAEVAIGDNWLHQETFGPLSVLVTCEDETQWLDVARHFHGSLTTTVHVGSGDDEVLGQWLLEAERFAGRIIYDGWPTGMEIGSATHHGGPYPASLDSRSTSVGFHSLERFVRPVCYQNWPVESAGE